MSAPNIRDGKPEFPLVGCEPSMYTDDLEKWCCCQDVSGCSCCNPTGDCPDLGPNQITVKITGVGNNNDEGWDYLKCLSGCDSINGTYILGPSERVSGQCKWTLDIFDQIGDEVPGESYRKFCDTDEIKYKIREAWDGHPDCLASGYAAGFSSGWPFDSSVLYASNWYGNAGYAANNTSNPNAFDKKMAIEGGGISNTIGGDEVQYNAVQASSVFTIIHEGKVYSPEFTSWNFSNSRYWIPPGAFNASQWSELSVIEYQFTSAELTVEILYNTPSANNHIINTDLIISPAVWFDVSHGIVQPLEDGQLCALPLTKKTDGNDAGTDVAADGFSWPGTFSGFGNFNAKVAALCNWSPHGDYSCDTGNSQEVDALPAAFVNPQQAEIEIEVTAERV